MSDLAPCVAVIGPPNSGKSTLLHLLDAALQNDPAQPLAYVVKGNPDGSGRYLYQSPDLREALKPLIKGQWVETTPNTIVKWIWNARRNLEIALLDFGGRHSDANPQMLEACSHYIVLARSFSDDPAKQESDGMQSWIQVAERAGLHRVAHIHSMWQDGNPYFDSDLLDCGFRADAAVPGDYLNQPLIDALIGKLLELRKDLHGVKPYLDLQLGRRWQEGDLPLVAGRLKALVAQVLGKGSATLGGKAPIWAYAAAMHHALDRNVEADINIFDPKVPGAFVEIPATLQPDVLNFPANALVLGWEERDVKGRTVLQVRSATADRFLEFNALLHLKNLLVPPGPELKDVPVLVDGPGPIWLHLTLSRWLRSRGVRQIAHWDAGWKRPILVWPHVIPGLRDSNSV